VEAEKCEMQQLFVVRQERGEGWSTQRIAMGQMKSDESNNISD